MLSAIHIRRKLDSDTLHLPELRPLLGRTVEILVSTDPIPIAVAGTGDWSAFERCAQQLKDYDFDAWRQQRDFDLQNANLGTISSSPTSSVCCRN